MAKRVRCPDCGSWAYYAVVPRYIWKRVGRPDTPIEDARIIRCGACGDELPADDAELRRWRTIALREHLTENDIDEDQCDKCGCAESQTGQFFRRSEEKLCKACNAEVYGE